MAYTWTDDPLTGGPKKKVHIVEIHNAVNAEKIRRGLPTVPMKIYDTVLANDINDMREEIYLMENIATCPSDKVGAEGTYNSGDYPNYWNGHENTEDVNENVGEYDSHNPAVESGYCNARCGSNYSGTYGGFHFAYYGTDWGQQRNTQHCDNRNTADHGDDASIAWGVYGTNQPS